MVLPSEGAIELVDVGVTEDAPEAVARGELGVERARVLEIKADVGEFGLEPREEGGERSLVAREVLVSLALIVVQIAHLAELVLALLLLVLLLLLHSIGFRVRVSVWFLSL